MRLKHQNDPYAACLPNQLLLRSRRVFPLIAYFNTVNYFKHESVDTEQYTRITLYTYNTHTIIHDRTLLYTHTIAPV